MELKLLFLILTERHLFEYSEEDQKCRLKGYYKKGRHNSCAQRAT